MTHAILASVVCLGDLMFHYFIVFPNHHLFFIVRILSNNVMGHSDNSLDFVVAQDNVKWVFYLHIDSEK